MPYKDKADRAAQKRRYRAARKATGKPVPSGTRTRIPWAKHAEKANKARRAKTAESFSSRQLLARDRRRMSQALAGFAPIIPLDVDAALMDAMSDRDVFERAEPFVRQFNDAPDVNIACRVLIAALAPSNTHADGAVAAKIDAEWFCYNCGAYTGKDLFCGEYCRHYGKAIRYIRKVFRDGRSTNSDQLEAIGAKILMLLGGGYPDQERRVPKDIRQQIFERDGVCVSCGSNENLTIDHIRGSSAPDDLRVLCMPCNRAAMLDNVRVITAPNEIERVKRELGIIAARVASPKPLRPCDADDWNDTWRTLRKRRTEAWKALS